jgi:outer membrane protein OmpA-like peptidoglycan-associated protein
MIDKFGVSKDRFSALGYADSRPAASNNTELGRTTNRRVEIVILRNNLLKTETLSQEFKKDLKKEITEFKNVTNQAKKDGSPKTSDAVQNLLKEGKTQGNVIIFDNSNDAYKKDAQQILKEIRAKEQQAEEESKIRKQIFASGVKKQF